MTHKDTNHPWQEHIQQQKDSSSTISCPYRLSTIGRTNSLRQKKQSKSIIIPLPTLTPQSPIAVETPTGYWASVSNESLLDLNPQLLKMLP
ncbi:hypothetical protein JCM19053_1567 [Vibrio sp. JCM 19053]|nr:hypothetical protein JCM19053_1567 [Vibrio sp. JCM 19053]